MQTTRVTWIPRQSCSGLNLFYTIPEQPIAKLWLSWRLNWSRVNILRLHRLKCNHDQALCKEVVLRGDAIDLTRFAFIQSNPADVDRYINTGSIFTQDPEMGMNYGTYRCQLRGPRLISVNPETNQTGWKHLMAAKERGEKSARASIVLGQDPYVWIVSSSRVANRMRPGSD